MERIRDVRKLEAEIVQISNALPSGEYASIRVYDNGNSIDRYTVVFMDVEPNGISRDCEDYDSFFVETANGDYTEVWAMCGIVPRLSKLVTRLV
jgi:hypothetical protein